MAVATPILVVGKSGQLARCLFEAGSRRDIRLVVAGRPDFDIAHRESVDRALTTFSPGIIINAAAYTAVDKAETEPERCYAVNNVGARQLAEAAWRRNVPLIHVSTDYVFDGQKSTPYSEDDLTTPLGVYGRSKLEGEQAVLAMHPEALIVRTSWVYSVYGSNFVTTMLRLAQSQAVLRVVDDQFGCPTSAHDLAAALLDVSTKLLDGCGRRLAGIYHLSGTGQTTWYRLAAEIFAGAKTRGQQAPHLVAIRTADYPTRAQRPPNSVLDCTKVNHAFGVKLPPWPASVTTCVSRLINKEDCSDAERYHSCRRKRHSALSDHQRLE
jgi:dTDP-4-dehydrorhamnose reductase